MEKSIRLPFSAKLSIEQNSLLHCMQQQQPHLIFYHGAHSHRGFCVGCVPETRKRYAKWVTQLISHLHVFFTSGYKSLRIICSYFNFFLLLQKSVFVSVGRGNVTTDNAVLSAVQLAINSCSALIVLIKFILLIRNGWLGGAILDVFEKEPLPKDSPLWDLPGVCTVLVV